MKEFEISHKKSNGYIWLIITSPANLFPAERFLIYSKYDWIDLDQFIKRLERERYIELSCSFYKIYSNIITNYINEVILEGKKAELINEIIAIENRQDKIKGIGMCEFIKE